jgi:hypothetical protein
MRRFTPLRTALVITLLCLTLGASARPAHAGTPPNRLDDNRAAGTITVTAITGLLSALTGLPLVLIPLTFSGRVIHNPHIFNVYWADDWNSSNPPQFNTSAINNFTTALAGSNYFAAAAQYGVGSASFAGSHVASACGSPGSSESFAAILAWITCEVQVPGTGVPYPDDNSLYNVWLPHGTSVSEAGPNCSGFGAYHFMSAALTIHVVLFVPVPDIQDYAFTVLPTDCANGSFDNLTALASHEIIEASTDPNFGLGWIDLSTFDFHALDQIAKEGEAADICEPGAGAVPMPPVRLNNGVEVAPYWSNAAGACFPATHQVTLDQAGLPNTVPHTVSITGAAITGDTNSHTFPVPFTMQVVDGGTFSFSYPSPVSDPNPGIRYVTADPGGSETLTADFSHTATYAQQDFLTVNTNAGPPSPPSLTVSGWQPDGSTVSLTTDPLLSTPPDRWRFDHWSGDVSAVTPATSIVMNGPKTATANYVLQHDLTFDQAGIPGFPWTVTMDGTTHSGPYSTWFDKGTSHTFSYQSPVPGTSGNQYVLTGTSEPSPLSATSTRTVIGTYKTQHLLTVNTTGLPSPNLATITNSGTSLGTANDSTPLAVWLDDGTVLNLDADANVNGANGIQYFNQGFLPVPPPTLLAPFATTVTYETVAQLIDDAIASGGISGPGAAGQAVAFKQQFAAVQADMAVHNYAQALLDLQSFISHAQAQCCQPTSGKKLSPATAKTFELDASLVYHNALCLARAATQITAATASADYTYYTTLVSSLGGSVLPPC